jgi:hypothetical protein
MTTVRFIELGQAGSPFFLLPHNGTDGVWRSFRLQRASSLRNNSIVRSRQRVGNEFHGATNRRNLR